MRFPTIARLAYAVAFTFTGCTSAEPAILKHYKGTNNYTKVQSEIDKLRLFIDVSLWVPISSRPIVEEKANEPHNYANQENTNIHHIIMTAGGK